VKGRVVIFDLDFYQCDFQDLVQQNKEEEKELNKALAYDEK
jgi:hypothetical protein